ncbi:MAG: histidinol-phosphate transaminase [Pseudomonadota bacterium]
MLGPRPLAALSEISPYTPGAPARPGGHKLSSNENPLGCSPRAREAVIAATQSLEEYPDGAALNLRESLGRLHGLDPDQIFIGAGSDEILQLICRAFLAPGDAALKTEHGFIIYDLAARQVGAEVICAPETGFTADVGALLARVTPATRIVFLANPNNPTGTCLPRQDIAALHQGLPGDVLLVLDAAYEEYVSDPAYSPGRELAKAHGNVLVTHTFSKIHGLAALRVGWCYGPAPVIAALHKVRGPFNVNAAGLAAARAAAEDTAFQRASADHNQRERARVFDALTDLGLQAVPSETNFLLLRFADVASARSADQHFQGRGLVLRRLDPYGLGACLRLSIGSQKANDAVIEAARALEPR